MSVKRMLIHKLSMAAYDNVKIEKKAGQPDAFFKRSVKDHWIKSEGRSKEETPMTIKEIAQLAGVSSAAVSRYLNEGYVSEEKREKYKKGY